MYITRFRRYFWFVMTAALVMGGRSAFAQGSIDLAIEVAKQKHQESVAKAKDNINKWFDDEDVRARNRKSGVSEQIVKLDLERKTYQEVAIIPDRAPVGLQNQIGNANSALIRAYKKAMDDLLREKRDDEAKALQAEMEQFIASLSPSEIFISDLAPTNSRTHNNRFSTQGLIVGTTFGERCNLNYWKEKAT